MVSDLVERLRGEARLLDDHSASWVKHLPPLVREAAERIIDLEDTIEALRISEATLNRAVSSEVALRNEVYTERVAVAESRVAELEGENAEIDAELDHYIALACVDPGANSRVFWIDRAKTAEADVKRLRDALTDPTDATISIGADAASNALSNWMPEPMHRMAYEDVARTIIGALAKSLTVPVPSGEKTT